MAKSIEVALNDILAEAWQLGIVITEMEVPPEICREIMLNISSNSRYIQAGGFSTMVYESAYGSTRILRGYGSNKIPSVTSKPSALKQWLENHRK